jgi:MoxR-like ATPase
VAFPDEAQLAAIILKRFGKPKRGQEALVKAAIAHFYEVRELLQAQPGSRPPGTSEILEILTALLNKPVAQAKADLTQLADRLPLLGILLKTKPDQDLYQREFTTKRNG